MRELVVKELTPSLRDDLSVVLRQCCVCG